MSSKQPEKKKLSSTGKLSPDQRRAFVIPSLEGLANRISAKNITYTPVPSNHRSIEKPTKWRIQLKVGAPARVVVGLDIYGDVILGRGSEGKHVPDIDLTNLDALNVGISRRHALIRPTQTRLFLIDLESTNGSYVNAVPVGRGMAQVIRHEDTIALAGLNFIIEIISSPEIDAAKLVVPSAKKTSNVSQPTGKGALPPISFDDLGGDATLLPGRHPGLKLPPTKSEEKKKDEKPKKD